ncbi:MAG: 1-deoxy-D-xylulose-5-phosphate synthase [Deltaproteobacteria bacterium]|nr:1-deoxy-D-xylulose-5-phosphate synthase [Deltaproteobacteria bacterium]
MVKLLDTIRTPKELRALNRAALKDVCQELRDLILETVSSKGGHFASNLGSVEITVALHYSFDTPADRVVWDVGHQAYGHKVLTGRKERFHTIRQHGGLSGFTSRSESEYDSFGSGHASTSISAALGIAEGMRHKGLSNLSIAVIGDGSLTGGLVYEAMNNVGHILAKNLVVILNDNEMAIDPNVGALAKFINRTVTHPGYNRLRKELVGLIKSISYHGGVPLTDLASKTRKSVKNFFTPGMLFECFGFRYFGPVNGHDIDALVDAFSFIKNEGPAGGPYLIHALTVKGKGYKLAEQMPVAYHGVVPFKIDEGMRDAPKKLNYQDVFADTLIRLAKEDPRIVAITAAMPSGTGLNKFQREFPNRCYDVGIAEGHAVVFAAGLATEGFRPVAAIYSTFLQRAYDQIIHDVGLQNLPVIFAMDRAGLVGADGATHQGAFDISYMRTVPNFVVMAPKDENELQHMIHTAVHYQKGPIAIRYPRGEVVGVVLDNALKIYNIGEAELLSADREKVDVALIAIGFAVQSAKEAQALLRKRGLKTTLINARFAKPLDEKLILEWIKNSGLVVTVEENTICGGFGSAVIELMSKRGIHRDTLLIGLPDIFIDHASPKMQREILRLDGIGIANQIIEKLRSSQPKKKERVRSEEETGAFLTH